MPSDIFGKGCAITNYSFMPANNTLHLTRTATAPYEYPDTAVYYNVHDMNLTNCRVRPSVYAYYNVPGGISMKIDPRPVDLTWRLAIEEFTTKRYTNNENFDLLFSAVLLAVCMYVIPNNPIVEKSSLLSFLYYVIKFRGDFVMVANAFTVKMTYGPAIEHGVFNVHRNGADETEEGASTAGTRC